MDSIPLLNPVQENHVIGVTEKINRQGRKISLRPWRALFACFAVSRFLSPYTQLKFALEFAIRHRAVHRVHCRVYAWQKVRLNEFDIESFGERIQQCEQRL